MKIFKNVAIIAALFGILLLPIAADIGINQFNSQNGGDKEVPLIATVHAQEYPYYQPQGYTWWRSWGSWNYWWYQWENYYNWWNYYNYYNTYNQDYNNRYYDQYGNSYPPQGSYQYPFQGNPYWDYAGSGTQQPSPAYDYR